MQVAIDAVGVEALTSEVTQEGERERAKTEPLEL